MSQQKMILAVCLMASLVAMVSAQGMNYQSCSNSVQVQINEYRKTIINGIRKLTDGLQETGSQATDLSVFQEDIDNMTNSWQSFASGLSQGWDMKKFTNVYLENISSVASLMSKSIRVSLISGTMDGYLEMGQTVYSANNQLLTAITQSCMPQRMHRVQPARLVAAN